jgi:predicted acylesterase/phospholipase RssA/CRP-like cAMP-binding protein
VTAGADTSSALAAALARHGVGDAPRREVAPGEDLVSIGEQGGDAYWVESGRLDVLAVDGSRLSTALPGELVGEFVALVGGERTATIRAVEPSVVRPVTAEALESLLAEDPALASSVRAEAARRIHDSRIREVLRRLLPSGDTDAVAAILERGVWRRLDAGERLFSAGEDARCAYVVVSGRLRRVSATDDSRSTGYLAAGSVVGEEGLAGGQRQVSVEAVRDAVVLEVGAAAFADLLVAHPRALAPVVLGLAGGVSPPRRQLDRTIAVAHIAGADPTFTERLAEQLAAVGRTAHLGSTQVDATLDRPGIAQASDGDPGEIRLLTYLATVQDENSYLLLEPDRAPTAWTRRVLRQADVLTLVTKADPGEAEQSRIAGLIDQAGPRALRVLVLVHPADADRPRGTAEVMGRFAVDHVLHVRDGSLSDLARLARTLAGRPVGLVLGGGGARGFAAIGVYRAMHALGIPVDAVGATSIGAPLGAGIAQAASPDEVQAEAERLFHNVLDYTLPLVSLLKGERASAAIRQRFDGWAIEDLWLPYFCVSTNLTQGHSQVHRSGDVATAVRASVAIPGAFPPVPFGDDLLVDGGVTNNLPVDLMRRLHPTAEIIAVDVAPAKGPRAKADYGLSVSGWQAMKATVGHSPRYPGLVAVLMRSMITGSLDHRDAVIAQGAADLLLDMDMRGVGLLDFERVAEVATKGYDDAMPRLEAWLDERDAARRPVRGVARG